MMKYTDIIHVILNHNLMYMNYKIDDLPKIKMKLETFILKMIDRTNTNMKLTNKPFYFINLERRKIILTFGNNVHPHQLAPVFNPFGETPCCSGIEIVALLTIHRTVHFHGYFSLKIS